MPVFRQRLKRNLCPSCIVITKAYEPPVIWYDRLINPSMRCLTWRGNNLTKLRLKFWVCLRFKPLTPYLCMIAYTGRDSDVKPFSWDAYQYWRIQLYVKITVMVVL